MVTQRFYTKLFLSVLLCSFPTETDRMSAVDIFDFLELYSLLLPKGYTPGVVSLERAEGGEDV